MIVIIISIFTNLFFNFIELPTFGFNFIFIYTFNTLWSIIYIILHSEIIINYNLKKKKEIYNKYILSEDYLWNSSDFYTPFSLILDIKKLIIKKKFLKIFLFLSFLPILWIIYCINRICFTIGQFITITKFIKFRIMLKNNIKVKVNNNSLLTTSYNLGKIIGFLNIYNYINKKYKLNKTTLFYNRLFIFFSGYTRIFITIQIDLIEILEESYKQLSEGKKKYWIKTFIYEFKNNINIYKYIKLGDIYNEIPKYVIIIKGKKYYLNPNNYIKEIIIDNKEIINKKIDYKEISKMLIRKNPTNFNHLGFRNARFNDTNHCASIYPYTDLNDKINQQFKFKNITVTNTSAKRINNCYNINNTEDIWANNVMLQKKNISTSTIINDEIKTIENQTKYLNTSIIPFQNLQHFNNYNVLETYIGLKTWEAISIQKTITYRINGLLKLNNNLNSNNTMLIQNNSEKRTIEWSIIKKECDQRLIKFIDIDLPSFSENFDFCISLIYDVYTNNYYENANTYKNKEIEDIITKHITGEMISFLSNEIYTEEIGFIINTRNNSFNNI